MTPKNIDTLLTLRDKECIFASMFDRPADTSAIDAMLAEVAPSVDNRVDLALGRSCAVLPEREDYGLQADLEMTRRIWNTTPPEPY